ncbi:MAG TPA: orotate phosphoribosyltransferase [Candidatus Bathyarchaeota archaeon]|nr:orotate phosphoribosyltransferase [Candidatus Bathyarchaeota archaeon]
MVNIERLGEREILAKILAKTGALKFGYFKLTSGRESPYYIDLRIIPSDPASFHTAIELLRGKVEKIGGKKFDKIICIPTAGIPYGAVIAYLLNKPLTYVREEVKQHGTGKLVEGIIATGDRVLLVDDLITTGKSLINAARAVRVEGGIVKDAVVLIDREEGGRENLKREGIRLHACAKISEIVREMYKMGAIERENYRSIREYLKAVRREMLK